MSYSSDLVTGFYFYGARFYYPAISRFISEDQNSGSITSPLSLNRYSYVEDNPESFNDPSGNVIAIPFGGQAYSIHPVAPAPAPAPPPAPSQPATPPPSTPASPSKPFNGNSATTQSTSIQQQKNPFLIGMTNTATTSSSGQYYGPPAPSGTTSTTKAIQRTPSNPTRGEAGAILVTIGFFVVGGVLAGATPFALVATGPGGLVVGAGAAGAFYGGANAVEYDWVEGGNATPQGAFAQGAEGIVEFVQGAMELFGL
jgi:RHS repeat-associated protein